MKRDVLRKRNDEVRAHIDKEYEPWARRERGKLAKVRLRQYQDLEEKCPGITERVLCIGDERGADKVKKVLGDYCPPFPGKNSPMCTMIYEGREWDEFFFWYISYPEGEVVSALESRNKHGSSGGTGDISIFDALAIYYLGYKVAREPEE